MSMDDDFTIEVNWTRHGGSSVSLSERELDIIAAHGVDMTDEYDVAEWYIAHLGQEVDGYWFPDKGRICDDWNEISDDLTEIELQGTSGLTPEKYWPEESEQ